MRRATIRFTAEEYKNIEDMSILLNKSISAYVRESSANMITLNYNYETIEEHTKVISDLKKEINIIVNMSLQTKEIYNADIQNIIVLLEEIVKEEKKLLKILEKDRRQKSTQIKKEVRKEIDKRLKR